MLTNIKQFKGKNTRVVSENMIEHYFESIVNWSVTKKFNALTKRNPNARLAYGFGATPTGMSELIDSNGDRYLIADDSIGHKLKSMKASTTDEGFYNIPADVPNNAMPSSFSISNFNPIVYRNILYSGAGLNSGDYPFKVEYVPSTTFECVNPTQTVPAGIRQLPLNYENISDAFEFSIAYQDTNAVPTTKLKAGNYYVKFAPVFSDGTISLPLEDVELRIASDGSNDKYLKITIAPTSTFSSLKFPTLKAFDVFIAYEDTTLTDYEEIFNYLGRIELTEEQMFNTYLKNAKGRFYYVEVSAGVWEMFFNFDNGFNDLGADVDTLYFEFVGDDGTTTYNDTLDTYVPSDGYTFDGTPPTSLDGVHGTAKIFEKWGSNTGSIYYDNKNRRLTTEMYEYIGISNATTLIPDYRYNLSAIVGNRMFTARTDSIYAYYSPPDNFNIYTYLNELILKDRPNALIPINEDILFLSDISGERRRVTESGGVYTVDSNLEFGCLNQKAWIKTAADEVFLASKSGAWRLTNHGYDRISSIVQPDFDSLTPTELSNAVVAYDQIKRQVWYIYSATKMFVYDIETGEWVDVETNHLPVDRVVTNDSFMLTINSSGNLYNFDYTPTAATEETVTTSLRLKLFTPFLAGKKMDWRRALINFHPSTGTVAVNGKYTNSRGEVYLRMISTGFTVDIDAYGDTNMITAIQLQHNELWR